MLTFAGIPLMLEDRDGVLARFLGQHLRLEDLRLFGGATTPLAGSRNNSQGGNSHLISLPTPNYPDAPALRLNTLSWPTGAARWSWFLGLATDSQLIAMREAVRGTDRKLLPGQLRVGDSGFVGTVPADGFSYDANFKTALSTEMWMLTPRCISGVEAAIPVYDSGNDVVIPRTQERIWLVPFVDARWFWQTKATPSYLYGNFSVEESGSDIHEPTDVSRAYAITFVGRYSRTPMTGNLTIDATDLTGATGTSNVVLETVGDATTNHLATLTVYGTGGTYKLSLTIPSGLLLAGMGAITQETEPIPFDASPEEIEAALHALGTGRVRWESLFENLETAIGLPITYDVPGDGWGWPDRVELDRPFESIGAVLDAVAHSTGRRLVRDIDGTLSLLTPLTSNTRFENNTSPSTARWRLIAGRETLSDNGWSLIDSRGVDDGTYAFRKGQFLPASINVVCRDLTRSTRKGTWGDNGDPWNTDGGRLVINVTIETADTSEFSDVTDINQWSLKAEDWVETIHTPSLNNKGTIDGASDPYTKLAGFIAGDYYDWRRRLYDARFVSVLEWRMTGFDDHIEFALGERISDVDDRGYGGYIAGTRIQSMPLNFGCSDFLNQIGSLCPWTEKFQHGKLREKLKASDNSRTDPQTARAWQYLPAMELQGEVEDDLVSEKLAVTVTNRTKSEVAKDGHFETHSWHCEKEFIAGGGGGGGGGSLIRFQIDTVDCEDRVANAVVTAVPCGDSSVEVGDEIEVWDKAGCFFDVDPVLLQDRTGYATYMKNNDAAAGPYGYDDEDCIWEVVALCVGVSSCGPLG